MGFGILVSLVVGLPTAVGAAASPALLDRNMQDARAQGLKGNFSQANALLESVAATLPAGASRARAQYELELGRILMTEGNVAGSVPHFRNALATAKAARSDALAVDAQVMLAVTAPAPAEQLAGSEAALRLATSSKDPAARRWAASIWNNIGATQDEMEHHKEALAAFRESRAACTTQHCMRIADWKIAHVTRELGQYAQAKVMLESLEKRWTPASKAEVPAFDTGDGLSYVLQELGEVHLAMASANPSTADQDRKSARAYFARAYSVSLNAPKVAPSLADTARIDHLKRMTQ
jgi:tetratricopeptide (TPR) repeat protein